MNMTFITAILALIQQVLGASSPSSSLISKIVVALIDLVPLIVKEYQVLLPVVQNIITALTADPSTTAAQMQTLKALNTQVDAAFEAAAAAALAEDAAADGAPSA